MKKKFPEVKTAFTLAETLLTLAIVGVIAALTIPTLKDYSDELRQNMVMQCFGNLTRIKRLTGIEKQ